MSLLFPRVYYTTPSRCNARRCGPASYRSNPIWNVFEDTINEIQRASQQAQQPAFNPRFNVTENETSYTLDGEVPGVEQQDISIEFSDESTIHIKGQTHKHSNSQAAQESTPAKDAEAESAPAEETASDAASTKTLQATVEDDQNSDEWVAIDGSKNTQSEKGKEKEQAQEAPQDTPLEKPISKPEPQTWVSERHFGQFSRSFRFQKRIDRDAVTATLKNGLLQITIPKAPAPTLRQINIE